MEFFLCGVALRNVDLDKWKCMENINAMMVESMQDRTGAKYTAASANSLRIVGSSSFTLLPRRLHLKYYRNM